MKQKSISTSDISKKSQKQMMSKLPSITIPFTRILKTSHHRRMALRQSIFHPLTFSRNSSIPKSIMGLKFSATFDLKTTNTTSQKQQRHIMRSLPLKSKISLCPSTMHLSSSDPTSSTKMSMNQKLFCTTVFQEPINLLTTLLQMSVKFTPSERNTIKKDNSATNGTFQTTPKVSSHQTVKSMQSTAEQQKKKQIPTSTKLQKPKQATEDPSQLPKDTAP